MNANVIHMLLLLYTDEYAPYYSYTHCYTDVYSSDIQFAAYIVSMHPACLTCVHECIARV